MSVRILGICGSPIPNGNTQKYLEWTLRKAEEEAGVETEWIALAGKEIQDCRHCNWCVRKQEEGRFCALEDDMQEIYPRLLSADALLLATPVYIGRLSGYLAAFMDRLRVFIHGNLYGGALRDKVGGALAVGWFRHTGVESALQSIVLGFLIYQMIPAGSLGCPWGAAALASEGGTGRFSKERRYAVLEDDYGLQSARNLVGRVVSLARSLRQRE
jgi:multimeric flavodoxin WrbA